MTRLTTIARTGRLTKRSVNFISRSFPGYGIALAVLRLRGRVVGRLNLVVDDDGGAVAELEYSGGHHFFAGLDAGADGDLRLDEHSGPQLAVRVTERGLNLNVARGLVDDRVQGRDRARRVGALDPLSGHADLSADSKLAQLLLRHGEVHVDRVERLERHDRIAGLQVLAEVDLADAENPGKRRPDRLAPDRGLRLPRLRDRLLVLGRGLVVFRLRGDAFLTQTFYPLEVDGREAALRLGVGELRLFLTGVEPHEHVAGSHFLAGVELDPRNEPGQVGGDGHAVHGLDRPDGGDRRRPPLLPRADRGHRFGRRLKGRVLRDARLDLPVFHGSDDRDECGHPDESQDHSLFHGTSPCLRLNLYSQAACQPVPPPEAGTRSRQCSPIKGLLLWRPILVDMSDAPESVEKSTDCRFLRDPTACEKRRCAREPEEPDTDSEPAVHTS